MILVSPFVFFGCEFEWHVVKKSEATAWLGSKMEGKVAIIQEGSDCSSLIPHPHLQFPAADGVRTVRYETIYSRCCKAIKLYTDYRSIRIKRQNGEKRKKKKKRKKSIV